MAQTADKTPLTEQQARALAHWWGGRYEMTIDAGEVATVCHGVLLTGRPGQRHQDAAGPTRILSLEEAQEMENRRGFQEACSPDWLG